MTTVPNHKKRFSLLKIFLAITAVNVFLYLAGIAICLLIKEDGLFQRYAEKWYLTGLCIGVTFFTFFYYVLLNLYYQFYKDKKATHHFIKPILISIVALAGYYSTEYFLMPHHYATQRGLTVSVMLFAYFVSTSFMVGFSLLIAYLIYLRDEKKQQKVLEAQKLQLEIEKAQANYNFLKAQINPHFLHNTLNFLYAKSLPFSPELSEGILTLSEIMRYSLGETSLKDGKAALKDEVEHMRNVIRIHQLRFENNLQVHFEVNGLINGATIIPFVLITIVENAFKHGHLKSPEHPIEIKLTIDHNSLYFYCRNKKKTGPKELSTGIGLNNIKKRLDLAYGHNYHFNIKDEADFYTSQLTIYSI